MAPKRGTKRAAEETAVCPLQETLRKHNVTKVEFSAIEEAVKHPLAPGVTEDCRKMLLALLPHSVCVRSESRTKQQQASVEMVTELMQGIMAAMQAEIDIEDAQLSEVEASKLVLDTKVQETQAAFAKAFEAFAERKRSLAEAAKAVLAAKATLAEKQQEQQLGDKADEKAAGEKAAVEATLANEFRMLRDGEVEGEEVNTMYSKLEEQASKLSLEASLITALPPCMTKKPSERGSFDAMVVAQLEEALRAQLARLSEALLSAAPAAEARLAAVDLATQQLTKAKEAQQVAADEMTAADAQQQERKTEEEAAATALAAFLPKHTQAVSAKTQKLEQLQTFKDWNLACFETVRDRVDVAKKQKTTEDAELPGKEAQVAELPGAQVAELGA